MKSFFLLVPLKVVSLHYYFSQVFGYQIGDTIDVLIRKKCSRHGRGNIVKEEVLKRQQLPRFGIETSTTFDHLAITSCGDNMDTASPKSGSNDHTSFISSISFLFSHGAKAMPTIPLRKNVSNDLDKVEKVLEKLSIYFLYSRSQGEILSILRTNESYNHPPSSESMKVVAYQPFEVEYLWEEEASVDTESGMVFMMFVIFVAILSILLCASQEDFKEYNYTEKVFLKKEEENKDGTVSNFHGYSNEDNQNEIFGNTGHGRIKVTKRRATINSYTSRI